MDIRAVFDLNLKGLSDAGIETLLLAFGQTLLVARSRGLGRVLLWTSSFDVSWPIPLSSMFPMAVPLAGWQVLFAAANITQKLAHLPLAVDEAVQAHAVAGDAEEESLYYRPVSGRAGIRS